MIPLVNLFRMHDQLKIEIDEAIKNVIENSSFIGGEHVETFEQNFASIIECESCISCANGTDALYIATKALGIKPGDEVLVPAMSWVSTSEVLSMSGAKPIFVDIEPKYYCLDPNILTDYITEKTVGIIPVHLYGHPADMPAIMAVAKKYNLWVIEDCAQAHLAEINGKKVGNFGDIGTFSFFPGKNLGALGDAGAITTNNVVLADYARKFANHGQLTKHAHEFDGINSRLDALQAAILNIKLQYLSTWTAVRTQLSDRYNEQLDNKMIIRKPSSRQSAKHVWHLYSLLVEDPRHFQNVLSVNDISSTRNYPRPLSRLNQYQDGIWNDTNARELANHVVNIPMCPMITAAEADHIIKVISDA